MLFRLSNITKSYGDHEILKDVSFQINPGERVGLVGRNGVGKTTIFRIVNEEESADSGQVSKINGLKIAMLEQHVDFSDDETVHTAALGAFRRLHDIEAELRSLEKKMETDSSEETLARYSKLQNEFENEGGFEYTAKAESILLGIGFGREDWDLNVSNLSGGQKNRLGMVRLLLAEANVLLLDEPTNHLDVGAVEWLEEFLQSYENSFVIISHDRYFLDRTCTRIIEVENGKAFSYKGNYSKYVVESSLQKEQRQREFENQRAFISKTEAFIRKNLAGQKTKQAKSRRNMLARMERLEAVNSDDRGGNFRLQGVQRTGTNVLKVEGLTIGYPGLALASDLDFLLLRGECLGVIGGNGTGKTTFLKTILGTCEPLEGTISWGTKVNVGYYSQELEELSPESDLIAEMRKVAPNAENGDLRSFLAGFLFYGEDVFKRVGDLSGGEKGRLSLAKLIYSEANVLILDEPTNHLDIPSREALENALSGYDGTIITVSHDRYFLDQIATQTLSLEGGGEFELYYGNYSEFHNWKDGIAKGKGDAEEGRSEPNDAVRDEDQDGQQPVTNTARLSKNERKKLEQRAAAIEVEIGKWEEESKRAALMMSDPKISSENLELEKVTKQYEISESQIRELYAEWEEILEQLQS